MNKSFLFLLLLLSSVCCFADGVNMVGDPPDSHTGDGHRACLLRGLGMSLEEYLKLWAEQLIIANHIRHY